MGEAENELRDVPRRIARERVPTIALSRDSLVLPYVDAHVQRRRRTSKEGANLKTGEADGQEPQLR